MRKITILLIIAAIIVLATSTVVAKKNNYYYGQYGHYYSAGAEGSIFVPEGCSEKDVKIATVTIPTGSNRVRFWLDNEGKVTKTKNLTQTAEKGTYNSWGNVDPSGCWHVFQVKKSDGKETIWIGSTYDDGNSWLLTEGIHPDWNQITGEIIFSKDGDIYTINMFGKNLKSLGIKGDYPKFFPNGKWILYQDNGKIYLYKDNKQSEIGIGQFAIPNKSGFFIINNHKIEFYDIEGKKILEIDGDNIAPDPRKQEMLDIIEVNNKLFLLDLVDKNIKSIEWNENLSEPIWWVEISQR